MRDIKYRVYDKILKQIVPFELLSVDTAIGFYLNIPLYNDDKIPMQYTGLTDRNGTDVYEGDILKAKGMSPAVVIFEKGCFRFEGGQPSIIEDWEYYDEFEIVGNIHENPQLLMKM